MRRYVLSVAGFGLIGSVLFAMAGCGGSTSVAGIVPSPPVPPDYTSSAREFILTDGSHLYVTIYPSGTGSSVSGEAQLFPSTGSTKDLEIFDVTGTIEGSQLHLVLNGNTPGGAATYFLDGTQSVSGDEKLQLTDGTGKDVLAEPPQTIDSPGLITPATRIAMRPMAQPPMTGTGLSAVTLTLTDFFGRPVLFHYNATAGHFIKGLPRGRGEQGGLVGTLFPDGLADLWMVKWPAENQWAWYETWENLKPSTLTVKRGSGVIRVDPSGYFWLSEAQDAYDFYGGQWFPCTVTVLGPSPYLSLHNGPN